MKSRGLSNVITTVLIILLAIAAVVIIWSFVQPVIQKGGAQLNSGAQCLQLDISPVNCKVNTNGTAHVVFQNNGGDALSVKLIITNQDGENNVVDTNLPSYGTNSKDINNVSVGDTFSIVGVVKNSDGTTQPCNNPSPKITCVAA